LFFDPVTFLLKEQRFMIPGSTYNLTIKYLRHLRIEGKSLPSLIEVILFDGTQTQRLELEFTRTDLTDALSFPFEIPRGYSKIEF
jgi:ssRNA-specific RNase YbeY (16S rRNA maturation enzyme)